MNTFHVLAGVSLVIVSVAILVVAAGIYTYLSKYQ
jgi:hypothetical protein